MITDSASGQRPLMTLQAYQVAHSGDVMITDSASIQRPLMT